MYTTVHGYIRLAERNDDLLDHHMTDLCCEGVDPENIVFDIGSDIQVGSADRMSVVKRLMKTSIMAQVSERGMEWKQDAGTSGITPFTHATA